MLIGAALAGATLLATVIAAVLGRSLVAGNVGQLLEQLGHGPGAGHGAGRARWLAELFTSSGFGNSLTQSIVVAGAIGAVFAGTLGFLGAAWIARPLSRLSQRIRRMAAGDYGDRELRFGPAGADRAEPSRPQEPSLSGPIAEVGEMSFALDTLSRRLAAAESLRRRLVEDMAHELRSPLTAIRGYAEGLRDGVFPQPSVALSGLQRELARVERLIADLRRSALPTSPAEFWPVDLGDLAVSVARGIEGAARRRGIELEVSVEPGGPYKVIGDPDRLGQVIANLLDNAVKFTPPGGRVKLEIGPQAGGESGEVRVAVRDTGLGIPPRHLPHVFDRLYRAEPSRSRSTGGTGIGLAIVKQIVLAHGGTVEAQNLPEGGALLVCRLPPRPGRSAGGARSGGNGLGPSHSPVEDSG